MATCSPSASRLATNVGHTRSSRDAHYAVVVVVSVTNTLVPVDHTCLECCYTQGHVGVVLASYLYLRLALMMLKQLSA